MERKGAGKEVLDFQMRPSVNPSREQVLTMSTYNRAHLLKRCSRFYAWHFSQPVAK